MKKFMIASLVLASAAFAQAAEVTVLSTNIPATRGPTTVDTKFYIDTEMKEGFAKFSVEERYTVYVRVCNSGPSYPGPRPYPGNYCRTVPQTHYRTILTDKVKIEGMTMNGDEVIYQGAAGDVVCGTMGRSRVFRVPTFYLSGKCDLDGKVVRTNTGNLLTVTFKTK